MARSFEQDDPERMIAMLNRNRQLKVFGVVAGILLALTTMVVAAAAMYSADPAAKVIDATATR